MERKKHKYTEQEAYTKLSALCAVAEYCLYDMRKKMKEWSLVKGPTFGDGDSTLDDAEKTNEECKERILKRLVEEKFIDENRYAHAFVRDKFRYNKWGKVRITQELRMRCISQKNIDEALEEIDSNDNLDTLRELITKKRLSVKGKSEYEIRCKLIRFALGRGFSMDDAVKVVGDLDEV